jgi:phosphatidate cytidylyltransferase
MGFFASGLKRAYHVKDFNNTLPGHGGYADRMDCISMMCFFNYIMLTQGLFREEIVVQDALSATQSLPLYAQKDIL